MPVLVMCQDSADAPNLRETHQQAHRNYIETIAPMICVSGSMSQSANAIDNDLAEGTCYIYDTDDLSVARKLLEHDPYSRAGVYSQVAFAKYNPDVGHWIGGVNWR